MASAVEGVQKLVVVVERAEVEAAGRRGGLLQLRRHVRCARPDERLEGGLVGREAAPVRV